MNQALFGAAHVVGFQVGLDHGTAELLRQLHAGGPGDAAQNVVGMGRQDLPVLDHEEVVPRTLGDEAALVGEQGHGPLLHAAHLQVGALVEDAAAALHLGVDVARRHRLLLGDDEVGPRLVLLRHAADVAHQGDDVDRHDRPVPLGHQLGVEAEGAAGDVVHDLEVEVAEGLSVALDGGVRGLLHLVDGHLQVDLGVVDGGVEALEVVAQPVGLLPEGARHLEDHVPVHQGRVEDGDAGLLLGDELPVEVDPAARHEHPPLCVDLPAGAGT